MSMEAKYQVPPKIEKSSLYNSIYWPFSVSHFKSSCQRSKEKDPKKLGQIDAKWEYHFPMPSYSSTDFEYFRWKQRKNVVLSAIGCFGLLVLSVLLVHCATEGLRLTFAIPLMLTAGLSFSLFFRLIICYESGQNACRCISSMLFFLTSLSWVFDNSFDKAGAPWDSSLRQDLQYIDLLMVTSLPCFLSHALFLSWKNYFAFFCAAVIWFVTTSNSLLYDTRYSFRTSFVYFRDRLAYYVCYCLHWILWEMFR